MQENRKRVVCLMGPTASGKTDLAIKLAQKYPFEIISVDSALVYKGLDIGAAKPSHAELALAPHRLISFLDPAESYSVSRFREDAIAHITEIWARGNTPLLVGGTMLYFRALLLGLSDLPSADAAVRAEIDQIAADRGWPYVHQLLSQVDPVSAARLQPNDTQRVQRALEVYKLAGKPLSAFQTQKADHHTVEPEYAPDIGVDPVQIAIMPKERSVLHQRIESRFDKMLTEGFVDEVNTLFKRGDLSIDHPAVRAVGYRQVWSFLRQEYDYEEMRYRGVVATRQLAKRQLTWLRNWQGLQCFMADELNHHIYDVNGQKQPFFETVDHYLMSQLNLSTRVNV